MKDIKGFEKLYAITKGGRVWAYPKTGYKNAGRWKNGRFLKPWLVGHGYETVTLYGKEKSKKFLIHRLVALTYIPNIKNLKEVNHKDSNILNNKISNLEWVSSKDNKTHAWENNLYTHRGINHYLAKLNENKIKKIKTIWKKGNITQIKISKIFNISPMTISLIVRNKTWKHVI